MSKIISLVEKRCEVEELKAELESSRGDQHSAEAHDMYIQGEMYSSITAWLEHNCFQSESELYEGLMEIERFIFSMWEKK